LVPVQPANISKTSNFLNLLIPLKLLEKCTLETL
jgi:hypothetical protein